MGSALPPPFLQLGGKDDALRAPASEPPALPIATAAAALSAVTVLAVKQHTYTSNQPVVVGSTRLVVICCPEHSMAPAVYSG